MWRAHFTCHLQKRIRKINILLGQGLPKTIGKEHKDYFSLQFECEDFPHRLLQVEKESQDVLKWVSSKLRPRFQHL
jgi:hypothetical protein